MFIELTSIFYVTKKLIFAIILANSFQTDLISEIISSSFSNSSLILPS